MRHRTLQRSKVISGAAAHVEHCTDHEFCDQLQQCLGLTTVHGAKPLDVAPCPAPELIVFLAGRDRHDASPSLCMRAPVWRNWRNSQGRKLALPLTPPCSRIPEKRRLTLSIKTRGFRST